MSGFRRGMFAGRGVVARAMKNKFVCISFCGLVPDNAFHQVAVNIVCSRLTENRTISDSKNDLLRVFRYELIKYWERKNGILWFFG